MARRIWLGAVAMLLALSTPRSAPAGMPSFTLGDVQRSITRTVAEPTRMRLEAISFFLIGILLSASVVRWIWNSLGKDFAWLPRLTYAKALGVVVLWGFLFVLVLTMISGARELMTPGAWKKIGLTYRLNDDSTASAAVEAQISARYQAIERLRDALFDYAKANTLKNFPTADATDAISNSLWQIPGTPGERYIYRGGRLVDEEDYRTEPRILAYESEAFGPERLVLRTDGWIIWMPIGEIERALTKETP